jgi:hypothetical protein
MTIPVAGVRGMCRMTLGVCVCVCVCVCVRTRAVCWRELDKLEVLRSLCISWFTLGVVDKSSVQMRTWGFTLAT